MRLRAPRRAPAPRFAPRRADDVVGLAPWLLTRGKRTNSRRRGRILGGSSGARALPPSRPRTCFALQGRGTPQRRAPPSYCRPRLSTVLCGTRRRWACSPAPPGRLFLGREILFAWAAGLGPLPPRPLRRDRSAAQVRRGLRGLSRARRQVAPATTSPRSASPGPPGGRAHRDELATFGLSPDLEARVACVAPRGRAVGAHLPAARAQLPGPVGHTHKTQNRCSSSSAVA